MKSFLFLIKYFLLFFNLSNNLADGVYGSYDNLFYKKNVKAIFICDFFAIQYLNKSIGMVYGVAVNDIFHSVFFDLNSFRVGLYFNNSSYINIFINVLLKFFKFKYFVISIGTVDFRFINVSIFINYNRIFVGYIKSFCILKKNKAKEKNDSQLDNEVNNYSDSDKSEGLSEYSEKSSGILENGLISVKIFNNSLYFQNIEHFYKNISCLFYELYNFTKYQLTINAIDLRNDLMSLSYNYKKDDFYLMLKEFCSSSNKLFTCALNKQSILNNDYYNLDCSNFISDVYLKGLYINDNNFRQNLNKICLYKKSLNDNLNSCISSFCYLMESCVDLNNLNKTKARFESLINNLDKNLNFVVLDNSFPAIFFEKNKNKIELNQNLIKNEEKKLLCDIYIEIYLYFIKHLENPYEKNDQMFKLKLFSIDNSNLKNKNFTFDEYKIKIFNMEVGKLFNNLCKKINSKLYLDIISDTEVPLIVNIADVVKFLFIKNFEFEDLEVVEVENYISNLIEKHEKTPNIFHEKRGDYYSSAHHRLSVYRIKLYVLKKLCFNSKFRNIVLKLLKEEIEKLDLVNFEIFDALKFYSSNKDVKLTFKNNPQNFSIFYKINKNNYLCVKSLFCFLLTSNNKEVFNKRKIFFINTLNKIKEDYLNIPHRKYLESLEPSIIEYMKEDQLISDVKNDVATVKDSSEEDNYLYFNKLSEKIAKYFEILDRTMNLFNYLKDLPKINCEINSQDKDYPKFLSEVLKIFVLYLKKYNKIHGKLPDVKDINKCDQNIIDSYLNLSNMMHENTYYYLAYQMICDNEFLESKLMELKEPDDYYYLCDREDIRRIKRNLSVNSSLINDISNTRNICLNGNDFYKNIFLISFDILKPENYINDLKKNNYISFCAYTDFKNFEIEVENSLVSSSVSISDAFIKEIKDFLFKNDIFNLQKKNQKFILRVNVNPIIYSDIYQDISSFQAAKTVYKCNNESINDRLGYKMLIDQTFSNEEKLKLILPKNQEELNHQLPDYLVYSLNVHSKRIENIFNLYSYKKLSLTFINSVFKILQNNVKYIVEINNDYSDCFFEKLKCNMEKMKEELNILLNNKKIANLSFESKAFVNNTKRKFKVYEKMFEAMKKIENQHTEEFYKLLLQFIHYMPLGFKDEFIFDIYLHNVSNKNIAPFNKFGSCMRNF